MAETGDFLLAIDELYQGKLRRTDLLFHGGDEAIHSEGCILLGPVSRGRDGKRVISPDHPLAKLRSAFYGGPNPNSSPDRQITIMIVEPK
jgi:hypothetical protein